MPAGKLPRLFPDHLLQIRNIPFCNLSFQRGFVRPEIQRVRSSQASSKADVFTLQTLNQETDLLQVDHDTICRYLQNAEFQLLVITNVSPPAMDSVKIYAELRHMKEILLAHKVSLEENLSDWRSVRRLQGSFLVCFLAMLLERKARVELLEDRFSAEEFDQFVSVFHLVEKLPGPLLSRNKNRFASE